MPAIVASAKTEVLGWNTQHQKNVTCVFGQITVLATIPHIYYCGAEWYGVGGYCGIQNISEKERRAIFSIWDTSPTLHAVITQADPQAVISRFGNEGNGAHTHIVWRWQIDRPFEFFLKKQPAIEIGSTDTSFYIFDYSVGKWRHISTIESPNGPKNAGSTFNGIVSWIENIGGQAPASIPKLALYRLWVGPDIQHMKYLTHSSGQSGSGRWGQLNGEYFLVEGGPSQLDALFAQLEPQYGSPVFGVDGKELPPLVDFPLPEHLIAELGNLPSAPAAKPYH